MFENIKRKKVKARKEHKCDWCGETIKIGEEYLYEAFVFDGDFNDWHAHLACSRIVSAIWDYADPGDGMDNELFMDSCHSVCRDFICPDCHEWDGEYEECNKDESYCINKLDKFFETHELYSERGRWSRIWKCRLKNRKENNK